MKKKVIEAERNMIRQEVALIEKWTIEKNIELIYLQAVHAQALVREEIFWKEKSGGKWIKEGERNTAFFHVKVKSRRNKQIKN